MKNNQSISWRNESTETKIARKFIDFNALPVPVRCLMCFTSGKWFWNLSIFKRFFCLDIVFIFFKCACVNGSIKKVYIHGKKNHLLKWLKKSIKTRQIFLFLSLDKLDQAPDRHVWDASINMSCYGLSFTTRLDCKKKISMWIYQLQLKHDKVP